MRVDILLKTKPLLLKFYLLLAILESGVAFFYLTFIPSGTEHAIFAGYSLSRLLLLLFMALPFLAFGLIFVAISISSARLNSLVLFVDNFLGVKWKYLFIIVFSSLLVSLSVIFLLMPPDGLGNFAAIGERLAPLVYFGGFLGVQTLLGQFVWREQKVYFQNLSQWKSLFTVVGLLFAFVLILSAWVSWSGIGLKPETYGWLFPGTPITFIQLFAALLGSLLFMVFKSRIEAWYLNLWKGRKPFKFEIIIFLGLWLTAFLVWQAEPMLKHSYFNPAPTAPNFEYYPYSDAGFYDTTSQSILIGEGRSLNVILRPLYVFFLTILHMIGGQNYAVILTLQVLYLAIMPALVFLLVSLLGNQSAGMLAAILIIFREKNAIALTNIIEVSHSKLLLSDLLTMAFMLLLVYTLVNWLRKTNNNYLLGIVSGASFGLVVLVRSQAQLLLPILLAGIIFAGGFQWRKAIQKTLVFMLGLLIVILPWVWRNYQVSGKPVVENTGFYIRMLGGGYSEPADVVDILPGETFDEYNSRIQSQIVRYIFKHPVEIARVYTTYFIHNEISSVIYLPMSLKLYDLRSYVNRLPFWDNPYIDLAKSYGIMFFFTLGLITLGIGTAFQRLKLLGMLPLLIHFTYSLSVVVARISGWRYVLPVDWILQIYYCMGLIQLAMMVAAVIWNRNPAVEDSNNNLENETVHSPFFQRKTYLVIAGFLLIGLSLPVTELAMPVRYSVLSNNVLIKTYATDSLQLDGGQQITAPVLENFLATEPAATVLYGRALYPSYYEKGKFWGESSPNLLAASQFDRLQFTLIGPSRAFTFIPLQGAPQYFPQAADVFVIGCKQGDFIRALIIKVNDHVLTSSPWNGLTCSSTE
jgi:hypothetical protein